MTNELEKQFFDTFEIVAKTNQVYGMQLDYHIQEYPQITDRILLGLICILTKRYDYADQNWLTKCNDIKELKVSVLRLLLLCTSNTIEQYKDQVRTLFEEVEQCN